MTITSALRHERYMNVLCGPVSWFFSALLVLVMTTSSAPPALALAADVDALKLYEAGAYDGVLEKAEIAQDADTYALAARSLNAVAYFDPDRKAARNAAKRAQEYAYRALELNNQHVEAHLQAAISIALRGAVSAPASSFFKNLPARARDHVDEALRLDPENPWALSTLSAWNLEVHRRGGGVIYGAKPDEGYEQFLTARQLAPDNVAVAYEGALRLLASREPAWRDAALAALADAVAKTPDSMFERRIQERARALQGAIEAGRDAEHAFIKAQR